ncbi:MAG: peptidylprolyl isomerase [Sneathiella sp.]
MMAIHKLICGMLVAFLSIFGALQASAQDVQKIVAVVNEEVISGYDLVQRISLTILMSGFPDNSKTRQQLVKPSLARLVDDRLRLQEAARFNISVSDAEMNKAVDNLEKRNKVPQGQLDSILERRKISIDTLLEQIRAGIAWDKVIRRKVMPRINVTDEEVASLKAKMQSNKGKTEYFLSEIYIPVDKQANEVTVRKLMRDLKAQLKEGGNFRRIASQFSRGITATKGGDIGWTMIEDLEPEIAAAVHKSKKGNVSEPIRTADGYYIVAVKNVRKILSDEKPNALIELSQLVIPVKDAKKNGSGSSQIKLINSLSKFIDSCSYVPNLISEMATSGSGKMGNIELNNLPLKFQTLISDLKPGQASKPYLDKDIYRIFIVCNRKDQQVRQDSEEAVRQEIGARRIQARADRYLSDLRRDATIETR